jgi:hypothetical protein
MDRTSDAAGGAQPLRVRAGHNTVANHTGNLRDTRLHPEVEARRRRLCRGATLCVTINKKIGTRAS